MQTADTITISTKELGYLSCKFVTKSKLQIKVNRKKAWHDTQHEKSMTLIRQENNNLSTSISKI